MAPIEQLEFAVEQWDRADLHVEEVLARASNVLVARAAYYAAIEQRPKGRIRLRHGTRVIEDTARH